MTGGWRWQRLAVPVMQRDHLVYEVAEFPENGDLVAAVATTELKSRATANVTLVFVNQKILREGGHWFPDITDLGVEILYISKPSASIRDIRFSWLRTSWTTVSCHVVLYHRKPAMVR